MVRKDFLKYDLSFRSKTLEKEFTLSKMTYQKSFLKIVLLYGVLIGVAGWALNPFDRPIHQGPFLIFIILLCLIMVSTLCISRRWPHYSHVMILVLSITFFFGIMENTQPNREYWNKVMHFVTGINVEFFMIPLIFAKIRWLHSTVLFVTFNLLCIFRYIDFSDNSKMKYYPMVQLFQNIFLLSLSAYFLEKNDRESFYQIKSYEVSLSQFRDLIKNLFPSAIFICQKNKIVFKNTETLTIFNTNDENELWESFKKVKLEINFKNNFRKIEQITAGANQLIKRGFENLTMQELLSRNVEGLYAEGKFQYCFYGVFDKENNTKINLEVIITNLDWENQPSLMIIIKENKIIQEVKQLNDEAVYKDLLLATVSHDLRTPLNGIMGMISTALELTTDADLKKYLNISIRSSKLLLLMINDILDYSQISSGKLRLYIETFSLWDSIKDVTKLFKFQAKMKGLELECENLVDFNGGATMIRSDQNRIKQILFNLLGNALKFTPKGKIKLSLSARDSTTFPSSPKYATKYLGNYQISVKDTGIGIRREQMPSLFKFFGILEEEKAQALNKSGTGLGLAICKSLANILNNHKVEDPIKAESEYGKGSCFTFVLNSIEEEEGEKEPGEEMYKSCMKEMIDDEIDKQTTIIERAIGKDKIKKIGKVKNSIDEQQPYKILVVDDDQINIFVASSYLKLIGGYSYEVAFNGEEALAKIRSKAESSEFFDIILMDCNMPKMDGYEASIIINEMIDRQHIPDLIIIACSANASPNDYQLCFENGMSDYISKPFTKEELKRVITKNIEILEKRRSSGLGLTKERLFDRQAEILK